MLFGVCVMIYGLTQSSSCRTLLFCPLHILLQQHPLSSESIQREKNSNVEIIIEDHRTEVDVVVYDVYAAKTAGNQCY